MAKAKRDDTGWTNMFYAITKALPPYAVDLAANFTRLMEDERLDHERKAGLLYAVSLVTGNRSFVTQTENLAAQTLPRSELDNVRLAAALVPMTCLYYRTVTCLKDQRDLPRKMGLRLQSTALPPGDKTSFDLYGLAIAAVNNASDCIKSYQMQLQRSGIGAQTIHFVIQFASVVVAVANVFAMEEQQASAAE